MNPQPVRNYCYLLKGNRTFAISLSVGLPAPHLPDMIATNFQFLSPENHCEPQICEKSLFRSSHSSITTAKLQLSPPVNSYNLCKIWELMLNIYHFCRETKFANSPRLYIVTQICFFRKEKSMTLVIVYLFWSHCFR